MAQKKYKIIGTFSGKCCDSNVFNNNSMLLNGELFANLINSEEYKRGLKYRHYIGFLGHPDDPNCMDFEHACIIMTSMEIKQDGEIWGTFDLVDTPVGRVVKAFIDAGVVFGISIRGAGDLDASGVVDPTTFVFRGYDLVTFPAYDDAIPTFQEIAASTDIQKQSKYKAICAAVKANLPKIQSCEALEVIQSQFNSSSPEYAEIDNRIQELSCGEDETTDLTQQKLDAMTLLYSQVIAENQKLSDEANELRLQLAQVTADSHRKIKSMQRIMSSQTADLEKQLTRVENHYKTAVHANSKLKEENEGYISACDDLKSKLERSRSSFKRLEKEHQDLQGVSASTDRESRATIKSLESKLADTQSQLQKVQSANLIYQKKIESSNQLVTQRDEAISKLKSDLHETVVANRRLGENASNRDGEVEALNQQILACQQLVEDYQQAYADLYASAIGISVEGIAITGSTTPEQLKKYISASTSTSGIPAKVAYAQPEQVTFGEDDEFYDESGDIVSL